MKTYIFIILLSLYFGFNNGKAASDISFKLAFGGDSSYSCNYVIQCNDGGYCIAAQINGPLYSDYEALFIKTDSLGTIQWSKVIGGNDLEYVEEIHETSDNGFIMIGVTRSLSNADSDFYLIKTDASGDTLWTKTFGGPADDTGWSLTLTNDGGYLLAGSTRSYGTGALDAYLIKTDSFGDTTWTRTIGGPADESAHEIKRTYDGGYIFTGFTKSYGAGGYDVLLTKIDSIGNVSWSKSFGGFADDYGESVVQLPDSGFIIGGKSASFGFGSNDGYVIRTDAQGNEIWSKLYGNLNSDGISEVSLSSNNELVFTGFMNSGGKTNMLIFKTDLDGVELWSSLIPIGNFSIARSAKLTTDNGLIVAGYFRESGSTDYSIVLAKYAVSGNTGCVQTSANIIITSATTSSGTHTPIIDAGAIVNTPNLSYTSISILDSLLCMSLCDLTVSVSTNHLICGGASDGSIDVTISGGPPPLTYQWSNGATTQDISGIPGGNYVLVITDSFGCETYLTQQVTGPTMINLSYYVFPSIPDSATGEIDISISGGTPPYMYTWSNGESSQDLDSLEMGNYELTVVDNNNCSQVLLIQVNENGSNLPLVFRRFYGALSDEDVHDVIQTTDGGYVITGSKLVGVNNTDLLLVKMGPTGKRLWTKIYGGSDLERGYYVAQTADGGFIISGYTKSFGSGIINLYIVKTDDEGNITWTRVIGESNSSFGWSTIQQTFDGGYITTGCDGACMIKIDQNGNIVWEKKYWGASCRSVIQTADSGFVGIGSTSTFGAGIINVYLFKTDSMGNMMWSKTFGGTNYDEGYSVIETPDKGYMVLARTRSFGIDSNDIMVLKTDSMGSLMWAKTYGGMDEDIGYHMSATNDNSFIIVGRSKSYATVIFDYYAIKINGQGSVIWAKTYPEYSYEEAQSVAATDDGGYILVGRAWGGINMIKTDSLGNSGCIDSSVITIVTIPPVIIGTGDSLIISNFSSAATATVVNDLFLDDSLVCSYNTCDIYIYSTVINPNTNMNNGSIALSLSGSGSSYVYDWSHGDSTSYIDSLSAGIYTVVVKDSAGCVMSGTYALCDLSVTGVAGNATPTEAIGSIALTVNGGVMPLNFAWSNGDTTQNLDSLSGGTYTVTIQDSIGCLVQDTFSIDEIVGLERNNTEHVTKIKVFPNPNRGMFTVDLLALGDKINVIMSVYSIDGQLIQSRSFNVRNTRSKLEVNLGNNRSGIYFLRIVTDKDTITKKIIIQ